MHDFKLQIRATNKETTTFLYAMFVYNAPCEDWIQGNDESVFANFRIRPSTRIPIELKNFHSGERCHKFPHRWMMPTVSIFRHTCFKLKLNPVPRVNSCPRGFCCCAKLDSSYQDSKMKDG